MMIKFINKDFGTVMWVAEDRVDEYKATGHKLAAVKPAEKPKKSATKKK